MQYPLYCHLSTAMNLISKPATPSVQCETMANPSYYSKLSFIICGHMKLWPLIRDVIHVLRMQYIYTWCCILYIAMNSWSQ